MKTVNECDRIMRGRQSRTPSTKQGHTSHLIHFHANSQNQLDENSIKVFRLVNEKINIPVEEKRQATSLLDKLRAQ
jgi:hypothetical protein